MSAVARDMCGGGERIDEERPGGTVRDMPSLELFLRGRLRTAGLVAAGLAAAACELARAESPAGREAGDEAAGADKRAGSWAALDAEADARTPSPAQREASRRQGRALLRAARAAWPEADCLAEIANVAQPPSRNTGQPQSRDAAQTPSQSAAKTRLRNTSKMPSPGAADAVSRDAAHASSWEAATAPHQPIVLGAAVAAGGGDPADAAAVAAYQSVTGPASAAIRLLSLDPIEVSGLLARLAHDIDDVAERAVNASRDELPFSSGPALDLLAEAHARAEVRLFAS